MSLQHDGPSVAEPHSLHEHSLEGPVAGVPLQHSLHSSESSAPTPFALSRVSPLVPLLHVLSEPEVSPHPSDSLLVIVWLLLSEM